MPSSREVTVMSIAPVGEQDDLLAQREQRGKSRVNSGGTPETAATAQEKTLLTSGVTDRVTPGVEELERYLRVCVLCCQQQGALLTPNLGAHVRRSNSTG